MANELISIIIPTIGRATQLEALLKSIIDSTYRYYEIIIVDQNQNGLADDVIRKYDHLLPIQHVKVCFTGAARARNYGSQFAEGYYLFFPDDDAELLPETLVLAVQYLEDTGADVLFGKCVDRELNDSVGVFSNKSGYLSLHRHETMFIEATMFIKKSIFSKYPFDESFGVGTFYGSEEAYDLVLRLLQNEVCMFYTPEVMIYHPQKVINHSAESERRRAFSYRCGFAHLCIKHGLYFKYFSRLLKVILYIPYTIIAAPQKTRYYLSEFMGLLSGVVVR